MNVEWETPPPSKTRGAANGPASFLPLLKDRPGEWAVFRRNYPYAGSSYSTTFKKLGCELRSARTSGGGFDLYVRYVGGEPA